MIRRTLWTLLFSVFCVHFLCFSQPVVSILHFENLSGDHESSWMGRSLADGLTALLQNNSLILVERENLEAVIKEQKLGLMGLTEEETALEVGRILNAAQLITGGFLVHSGVLRITARITDTTTGEILYSSSVEEKEEGYFDAENALAVKLAEFYGFEPEKSRSHETESLNALNNYYKGLLYMDSREYLKASEEFQKALEEDPAFQNPRDSLEDSYRFLKDFRKARYQRELNTLYRRLDFLLNRAESEPFTGYGDWVMQAMADGMSAEELSAFTQAHPEITWGNTPVEVYWHAQNVMMEIAGYAVEYFSDSREAERMYRQMIGLSAAVQQKSSGDPFLAEVVYQELLAWRYLEEWDQVYRVCDQIMISWPDYRMMWAVEDFYESALSHFAEN